jgi:7SK snRNA methylphosphate capping enzyme
MLTVKVDYTGTAKAAGSAIHVRDPRLDHIQDLVPHLFTAKNCLDIGCNAGGVSCQLGKREQDPCSAVASDYTFTSNTNFSTAFDYHAASVTGVDIDPKLVGQAINLLALRASRVRPPTQQSERSVDWFPMSAVLKHGYIERKSHSLRGPIAPTTSLQWPRVSFYAADWATDQGSTGSYDVILALSVSIKQPARPIGSD